MNIILFGFIGCGKTYFGKRLSYLLGRPFMDTDDLIKELYAHHTGEILSVSTIHQTVGETAFRDLEKQVIHQLTQNTDSIIAVGGGAVLDPSNVLCLHKIGRLIYLTADFDTLYKWIVERAIPSFADAANPRDSLFKIYQERKPVYESISASWIDTTLFDEPTVLNRLCEELSYAF